MFPPCRLNERSQAIVTNLHHNIQTSPAFQHLSVNLKSELLSTGCMSIEISNQGQPVNLFMFCPDGAGDIGSVAIYGNRLKEHYATISKSRNIFGLPVTEISMDGVLSDFVDIQIGNY